MKEFLERLWTDSHRHHPQLRYCACVCVCVCVCVYVIVSDEMYEIDSGDEFFNTQYLPLFLSTFPSLPLLCYLPPFPSPLPLNSHISSFFSSLQKLLAICVCVWTTMVSIPDNLHRMSWEVPVYPAINIRYLQPSLIRRRTHTHSILTTHRQSDRRTTHEHTCVFLSGI